MALSAAAIAAITAGISALGGMGSAGISSARNMRIARYSADFERQMIQEQNAYNAPSAQMQRYQDAGLNPNLIYGQGSASAGNQSQIARYETPDLPTYDLSGALSSIASNAFMIAQKRKELELMDAEKALKQENLFNLRSQRMGQDIENVWKSIVTGFDPGLVMDRNNRDTVLNSKRMSDYDLNLQSKEVQNALHQAQKQLVSLNAKEKDRVITEMFDLEKELLQKQIAGKDVDIAIREVERDLQKNLSELGGTKGIQIIIDFLRAIFR